MDSSPNRQAAAAQSFGRSASRPGSKRFLQPQDLIPAQPARAWTGTEVFAEGQWQSIRVGLEAHGWNASQIEQIHDQLRQGWPLAMAENNVAVITGHCPIKARRA